MATQGKIWVPVTLQAFSSTRQECPLLLYYSSCTPAALSKGMRGVTLLYLTGNEPVMWKN